MTNIILDAPFDSDNLDKISQDETIIWRGAPSRSLSIFDLGLDFSFIIALVKRGAFFSWFILAFILYSIYLELNPISLTIWATIAITSIVAPEYLLIKRKMNTRYILTSKQLIFHLWWWGKKSSKFKLSSEIPKITKFSNEKSKI